jgi:hypothetical protein
MSDDGRFPLVFPSGGAARSRHFWPAVGLDKLGREHGAVDDDLNRPRVEYG